ncbi:hypothetical protein GS979_07465 [Rhodococcus hoagii]|nr:hypothetical protein [Prescottella equi]NKW46239.1 hypothetical protein [Prescottella equi]
MLSWAMTLRPGTTFSGGTPLDSAVVVASINRYNQRRDANSQLFSTVVESTTTTDTKTVTFRLCKPWRTFSAMLAAGHGMIVASSVDRDGAQFTPVGAGPFTVSKFQPQQELELAARSDYWGGTPNLDRVRRTLSWTDYSWRCFRLRTSRRNAKPSAESRYCSIRINPSRCGVGRHAHCVVSTSVQPHAVFGRDRAFR